MISSININFVFMLISKSERLEVSCRQCIYCTQDGNVCCTYNQSCQTSTGRDVTAAATNHTRRQSDFDVESPPGGHGDNDHSTFEAVPAQNVQESDRPNRRRNLFDSRTARSPWPIQRCRCTCGWKPLLRIWTSRQLAHTGVPSQIVPYIPTTGTGKGCWW